VKRQWSALCLVALLLTAGSAGAQVKSRKAAAQPVTVTLVRWPYT
jgi:hypothetical protein